MSVCRLCDFGACSLLWHINSESGKTHIFLQVTNLLNGYCFLREVGQTEWIWLDELKRTEWHASQSAHFLSALSQIKRSSLTPHPARCLAPLSPPGLSSWFPDSGSIFLKTPQNSNFSPAIWDTLLSGALNGVISVSLCVLGCLGRWIYWLCAHLHASGALGFFVSTLFLELHSKTVELNE